MTSARRPLTLPVAAVVAAGVAACGAVPSCPAWACVLALGAVLYRWAVDRRGADPFAGWRGSLLLLPVLTLLLLAGPSGGWPVVALAGVTAVAVAPGAYGDPATLLALSLLDVVLTAERFRDGPLPGVLVLYAAAFVLALVSLESGGATRTEPAGGARRVLAPPRPRRAARTLALALPLLLLALPASMLVAYVAPWPSPRGWEKGAGGVPGGGGSQGGAERRGRLRSLRDPGAEHDASAAFLSGGRTPARLGFVEAVKRDDREALRAVVLGGALRPADVPTLRGMTYDVFTGNAWERSDPAQSRVAAVPDEGAGGRWFATNDAPAPGPYRRIQVTDLLGTPAGHLWLWPRTQRVRLDPALDAQGLDLTADGSAFSRDAIPPASPYVEDAAQAPFADEVDRAESDAADAPLSTYAADPPEAEAYRRLARGIVAGVDPPKAAAQARQVVAWLRANCAYALETPRLDAKRPVLEFLEQTRRGSCELYASSMALLMRALGHPSRLAVGFRGGERDGAGGVLFRMSHAHAWCETWFRGVGWVAFDPTPPDSMAADAAGEEGPGAAEEPGADAASRGGKGFLEWLRRVLPWTLLATLLAAAFVAWRRSQRPTAPALAGAPAALARLAGPYGRALVALRSAGVPRPPPATPSEFVRRASVAVPPAAEPLARLTRGFEDERYGAKAPSPQETRSLEADADAVCDAAKDHRPVKR